MLDAARDPVGIALASIIVGTCVNVGTADIDGTDDIDGTGEAELEFVKLAAVGGPLGFETKEDELGVAVGVILLLGAPLSAAAGRAVGGAAGAAVGGLAGGIAGGVVGGVVRVVAGAAVAGAAGAAVEFPSKIKHAVASKSAQRGVKLSYEEAVLNEADRGQSAPVELVWKLPLSSRLALYTATGATPTTLSSKQFRDSSTGPLDAIKNPLRSGYKKGATRENRDQRCTARNKVFTTYT